MLTVNENISVEEAGRDLMGFILDPAHWVSIERLASEPHLRPGQNPDYQRRVGTLRICASVDVTPSLGVFLRIGFRAPGLTPAIAADHLDAFLKARMPLTPNTEWQVEVDDRRWIHFIRRYSPDVLKA
jgi:hypothetical protein